MTESEALAMLRLHTSPTLHPQLTDLELQAVLAQYVLEEGGYDSEGVNRAVADAWDLKCNKSTDHQDVNVNGRVFSAEQIKKNCEERARFYRRKLPVHVS